MTHPRSSIARLADDAPVPHQDSWPARKPPSIAVQGAHHPTAAYDDACAAISTQAARTVRRVIKERARAYALRPRELDAIAEGLFGLRPSNLVIGLSLLTATSGIAPFPRWHGFGGEVPTLNLRGATLYARYARAKARQIARRAV